MLRLLIVSILSLTVTACVTEATQVNAPKSTEDRIGSAITSPLTDFNIVQTGIPTVLSDAVKNPYELPPQNTCAGISDQVTLLDKALGPDLDAIIAHDKSNMEKGSDFAQNEAVGGVERTISGAIPFRSWIRKLSGAESRDSELHTAVAAGVVRRAFLKGMGQERGCEAPAAPLKRPAPDAKPSPACATAPPTAEAGSASPNVSATCGDVKAP